MKPFYYFLRFLELATFLLLYPVRNVRLSSENFRKTHVWWQTLVLSTLFLPSVSAYATHNKFKSWYKYYGGVLSNELKNIGGANYNNCSANLTAYLSTTNELDATSRCYNVYDCLYSGLLPNEQANFASAQVFLGLTPGLLATLGPSIGEISLLSLQRPLLSFFLALGGPAIYVPRLLTYDDPLSNLQLTTTIFPLAISLPSATTGTLLSVFQYILAMLATANVVQLSWQLGYRTVIAWKCNSSYLPFLWSTLPAVIHLCSSISWRWSQPMRQLKRDDPNAPVPLCKIKSWAEWLRRDFTLSVNTKKRNLLKLCHDNDVGVSNDPVTVFFNQAAGLMSFLHILFGTLVFSSLMFIATLDAMNVIARYLISGLACKLVVAYELNGMRIVETRRPVDEEPGEIKPPNS